MTQNMKENSRPIAFCTDLVENTEQEDFMEMIRKSRNFVQEN